MQSLVKLHDAVEQIKSDANSLDAITLENYTMMELRLLTLQLSDLHHAYKQMLDKLTPPSMHSLIKNS
jgi:hypothetical protein